MLEIYKIFKIFVGFVITGHWCKSLVQLKYNWSKECDKVCFAAACEETFHVPNLRSSINYTAPFVVTYVMQSPKIETICTAKLSFVVFVTNIFSTFGFWIGLSMVSFMEIIIDSVRKFTNRKATDRRIVVNVIKSQSVIHRLDTRQRFRIGSKTKYL